MYCSCNYSMYSWWSASSNEQEFLPKHDFSWDKKKHLLQKSKLIAIATYTTTQLSKIYNHIDFLKKALIE